MDTEIKQNRLGKHGVCVWYRSGPKALCHRPTYMYINTHKHM